MVTKKENWKNQVVKAFRIRPHGKTTKKLLKINLSFRSFCWGLLQCITGTDVRHQVSTMGTLPSKVIKGRAQKKEKKKTPAVINRSNNVLKRRLGEHGCMVTWGGGGGEGAEQGGGIGGEGRETKRRRKSRRRKTFLRKPCEFFVWWPIFFYNYEQKKRKWTVMEQYSTFTSHLKQNWLKQ